MDVDLDYDQRARIELIAIHSGRSPAQVLVDTADFLLSCEVGDYPPAGQSPSQRFLSEADLEARIAQLLTR